MGHDTCTFTLETVTVVLKSVIGQKDVNKGNEDMETACTKFLYTKDSFIFQMFVSQVLLCEAVVLGSNAVVLLDSCASVPLISGFHLGVFVSQLLWYSLQSLDVPLFLSKYHTR